MSFLTLRAGMMLKAGKGASKLVLLAGSEKMGRRNRLSTQASLCLFLHLTDTALLCCTGPNKSVVFPRKTKCVEDLPTKH